MRWGGYGAVVAALAGAALGLATPASATAPGHPGRIAYTRVNYAPGAAAQGFQGDGDIHVIDPDGTHDVALTSGPDDDFEPAFSPDGRTIAFASNRATGAHNYWHALYLMDADGRGIRRLTPKLRTVDAPAWSPDGRSIAVDTAQGIYLIRADGSHLRRLTAPGKHYKDFVPAWLDARTLIFTRAHVARSGVTASEALWTVKTNRTGARRLRTAAFSQQPDVSPTGDRIVFVAAPGKRSTLYTADVDGSHRRKVFQTTGTRFLNGPAFSPDGGSIVFTRSGGADARHGGTLLRLDVRTGKATRITGLAVGLLAVPNWQPLPLVSPA